VTDWTTIASFATAVGAASIDLFYQDHEGDQRAISGFR
jgi:hypothetical protein